MVVYKMNNRTVIYYEEYREPYLIHYTTEDKWETYLRVRKHIPTKVIIFDRLYELKHILNRMNYYI